MLNLSTRESVLFIGTQFSNLYSVFVGGVVPKFCLDCVEFIKLSLSKLS
jgi:hypothetical protein